MLTVSPVPAARALQIERDSWTTSSRAVVAPARAQQPDPEAVLAALAGLLHQPAGLQRADQAERRALVHPELESELAHPDLAVAGELLEDADRPVDRLHAPRALWEVLGGGAHGADGSGFVLRIAECGLVRRNNKEIRDQQPPPPPSARRSATSCSPCSAPTDPGSCTRCPASCSSTAATSWRASSTATPAPRRSSCGSTSRPPDQPTRPRPPPTCVAASSRSPRRTG